MSLADFYDRVSTQPEWTDVAYGPVVQWDFGEENLSGRNDSMPPRVLIYPSTDTFGGDKPSGAGGLTKGNRSVFTLLAGAKARLWAISALSNPLPIDHYRAALELERRFLTIARREFAGIFIPSSAEWVVPAAGDVQLGRSIDVSFTIAIPINDGLEGGRATTIATILAGTQAFNPLVPVP